MNKKPDRHSVFREPHLAQTDSREISSNEAVEHTVWDEPALADKRLPSAPIDGLTYDRWLAVNIENRSFLNSWVLTIALDGGNPLRLVIYLDEMNSGNPFRPEKSRTMQCSYWCVADKFLSGITNSLGSFHRTTS